MDLYILGGIDHELTAATTRRKRSAAAEGEAETDVRGCDLWAFDAEGKIVRKDSFWKIRETR